MGSHAHTHPAPRRRAPLGTHALAAAGDGHASGAGRALAGSIIRAAHGDVIALQAGREAMREPRLLCCCLPAAILPAQAGCCPRLPPLTTSQVPSGVTQYPDSHAVHLHAASYVLHLGMSVHCWTGQAGLATGQASAGSAAGGLTRTHTSGPSQACTPGTHALAAAGDGHASGAGRALARNIIRATHGDVSALPDRTSRVGHREGVSKQRGWRARTHARVRSLAGVHP